MNEITTIDADTGEVMQQLVDVNALATLTRAEIDTQISTARRFPRSIQRATGNILTLTTMDEETAAECNYALPRGGKPIQGPSVRLAEIIQQCWGNCRVAARVVQVDRVEKFVEAEGVYHDLETNSATMARVRRRIVDGKGRLYSDDMIIVTGNAACSIAKRNAVLAGVPKSVWRQAYDAARKVVAGDVQTLSSRRESAVKAFAHFGVTPERVFAALNTAGLDDINLDHIPVLRGMYAALKNGEATVEEMFSATRPTNAHQVVVDPLNDDGPSNVDRSGAPAPNEAPANGPAVSAKAAEDAQPRQNAQQAAPAPAEPLDRDQTETGAADPLKRAHAEGAAARASNQSRKALPGKYREPGAEALAAAWDDGFAGKAFLS